MLAHLAGRQPAVGMGGQQAVEVVEDVKVGDPERQPAVGMEPLLDPEQAGAPADPKQAGAPAEGEGRPRLGRSTDAQTGPLRRGRGGMTAPCWRFGGGGGEG